MDTQHPIDFCPAAACGLAIARLEAATDLVERLRAEAQLARSPALLRRLETIGEDLMLAADDARTRLSEVEPVSAAGAIAQLLAAIRDIRAGDDMEKVRARDLEARAVRFLVVAGFSTAAICRQLSHSNLGRRTVSPRTASHAI
ncbi:MAG: hypothetical protein Q8R02_19840 [Hyphomonadaceae bacterium]|nr:hypothetical protein [Hyphomonadaceae bacterium]